MGVGWWFFVVRVERNSLVSYIQHVYGLTRLRQAALLDESNPALCVRSLYGTTPFDLHVGMNDACTYMCIQDLGDMKHHSAINFTTGH